MTARGDFTSLHEYFTFAYAQKHEANIVGDWFREKASLPKTHVEVKKIIFEAAKKSPVFVKEMSLAMADFLLQDKELVERKNVYFLILVRNPHHCAISYYKGLNNTIIEHYSDWLGFESTYTIFKDLQKRAFNRPVIIEAENLYTQPDAVAQLLCKHLNIPFKESMINWPQLGSECTGVQEWGELKNKERTDHWHGNALQSTHFEKTKSYDVDEQGNPTFNEITKLDDRELCRKAYEANLHYYNLLLTETAHLLNPVTASTEHHSQK